MDRRYILYIGSSAYTAVQNNIEYKLYMAQINVHQRLECTKNIDEEKLTITLCIEI